MNAPIAGNCGEPQSIVLRFFMHVPSGILIRDSVTEVRFRLIIRGLSRSIEGLRKNSATNGKSACT